MNEYWSLAGISPQQNWILIKEIVFHVSRTKIHDYHETIFWPGQRDNSKNVGAVIIVNDDVFHSVYISLFFGPLFGHKERQRRTPIILFPDEGIKFYGLSFSPASSSPTNLII